jgi:hypothetical protein
MNFEKWLCLIEMAMKTEADLPENVYVQIKKHETPFMTVVEINLTDVNGRTIYLDQNEQQPLGEIQIVKRENFWDVEWVMAEYGYGPLMHDLAIEYATLSGSGLTSSLYTPITASGEAVWEKYGARKDVSRKPLPKHPSKFIYSKSPDRIHQLRAAGKLLM